MAKRHFCPVMTIFIVMNFLMLLNAQEGFSQPWFSTPAAFQNNQRAMEQRRQDSLSNYNSYKSYKNDNKSSTPGGTSDEKSSKEFFEAVERARQQTIRELGGNPQPQCFPECIKGDCRYGYGVYRWFNCTKYEGQFNNGKPDGKGTNTYASGTKYEGEFRDGKETGLGTRITASGAKYEGEHRNGVLQGKGALTEANGDRYEGQFGDGFLNGKGAIIEANGDRYEGEFRDGYMYSVTMYDHKGNTVCRICATCDMSGIDLSGKKLRSANLANANLANTNLTDADLSYTILTGADLTGTRFDNANLSRVRWIDGKECRQGSIGECIK